MVAVSRAANSVKGHMQEFEEDYYDILGVEETATPQEIKKAYLKLAKQLHPDRYPNDPERRAVAQSEFARVTRAHDVVSDEERRAEYDAVRILKRKKEQESMEATLRQQTLVDSDTNVMDSLAAMKAIRTSTNLDQVSTDETINVKWANKHLARAEDLLRRKRYQEAETAMKEAVRLCPKEPKYHNKLAEIYLARGWNTLAMTEVQTALRADPRDGEARALEMKVKAAIKDVESKRGSGKKSLLQQLKDILSKKL